MTGAANLQPSWLIPNFIPSGLGQREGHSENTLFTRSLGRLWDQWGQIPTAKGVVFFGRYQPFGEQQEAGRQKTPKASIVVTTCFRAIVKRALGEDGRKRSNLKILITAQPQTKQGRWLSVGFLCWFFFCYQLSALHEAHRSMVFCGDNLCWCCLVKLYFRWRFFVSLSWSGLAVHFLQRKHKS